MSHPDKKKALLIGNNTYENISDLDGCIEDVRCMTEVLEEHEKKDPNFSVIPRLNLTNCLIRKEVKSLLKDSANYALLYFSGHGYADEEGGYLCGTDSSTHDYGVDMEWLTKKINNSSISEITVILDCCHAGEMCNITGKVAEISELRKGVTILAATTKDDVAVEFLRKGVFTSILYEGLKGGAMDILGHVTPVSLYNNAETILSPWKQRPVFKSFVTQMTPLRYCKPPVRKRKLRELANEEFFKTKSQEIKLSKNVLEEWLGGKQETLLLRILDFERAGLLQCPDRKSVMQAIMDNEVIKLSPYGRFFWELVKAKQI